MNKSKTKRKNRSDKFPLTLHSTGQFCKKIKGKMHYFGKDKKQALERYLEQAAFLHNGKAKMFKATNCIMALKSLCSIYLQHQQAKAASAEITIRHHADQISCLKKFISFIGQHRKIDEISTLDLQNYKRKLKRAYNSAHRINLNISIMKTMFHWARKNDMLDYIPNIDAVSCVKIIRKQRHVFTSKEIHRLFDVADVQMKAMIWLGLNCGFGCTDCAQLKWSDLDLVSGRVKLARKKTGIPRGRYDYQDFIGSADWRVNRRRAWLFWQVFIRNMPADGKSVPRGDLWCGDGGFFGIGVFTNTKRGRGKSQHCPY